VEITAYQRGYIIIKIKFIVALSVFFSLVVSFTINRVGHANHTEPARPLQDQPELVLRLNRIFGYSGFGNDIQGLMRLRASGADDLLQVTFRIDNQVIAVDNAAPFETEFTTDDFPLGIHTLDALGSTANGLEVQSNSLTYEFVSAGSGMQGALKIIIPILVVVVVVMLISVGMSIITGRKLRDLPLGASRSYSPVGGTICPRCSRPFAVHLWRLNLLVGKLDRCPFCGHWSLVHRYPLDMLREAEARELDAVTPNNELTRQGEQDQLKRNLDDSRYQDL
jgi:hypothetical protein